MYTCQNVKLLEISCHDSIETATLQEELKIFRLRYSLLVEDELETREMELNRLLEHKKVLKVIIQTKHFHPVYIICTRKFR